MLEAIINQTPFSIIWKSNTDDLFVFNDGKIKNILEISNDGNTLINTSANVSYKNAKIYAEEGLNEERVDYFLIGTVRTNGEYNLDIKINRRGEITLSIGEYSKQKEVLYLMGHQSDLPEQEQL